ncbi:hypothetical protein Sta7437_1112 [Stanieria cyanosphaera PCC 7437]|uniref:Uncharacterized protein n=1 Tax=Stanieria cyanosphaera (strain ATCC 29371 / PCC 7437) TaxID=111780 RepID=K9XSN6_STAC7|nr:hypothetical protein [Stanieria cyanosphaera]AFZ34687.1 hypothetical protein Sta7437_1112 [Stanieria cyanosphaera PCC 7437]
MQLTKLLANFLFSLGISSLLVVEAIAVPNSARLAQNPDSFPNYCQPEESLFIVAETKGFWVNICGGDLPHTYVGVSKINGNKIRLPLKDYDQQGNYFEAVNKNVSYLLIRGSAKGDFLTVTQGERELFRQPVLDWHEQ